MRSTASSSRPTTRWSRSTRRAAAGRTWPRPSALDQRLSAGVMLKSIFYSAEINQCVRPAWRYYLLLWPPRRSARVLGVLARGVSGLLTRTFDFRTGISKKSGALKRSGAPRPLRRSSSRTRTARWTCRRPRARRARPPRRRKPTTRPSPRRPCSRARAPSTTASRRRALCSASPSWTTGR